MHVRFQEHTLLSRIVHRSRMPEKRHCVEKVVFGLNVLPCNRSSGSERGWFTISNPALVLSAQYASTRRHALSAFRKCPAYPQNASAILTALEPSTRKPYYVWSLAMITHLSRLCNDSLLPCRGTPMLIVFDLVIWANGTDCRRGPTGAAQELSSQSTCFTGRSLE